VFYSSDHAIANQLSGFDIDAVGRMARYMLAHVVAGAASVDGMIEQVERVWSVNTKKLSLHVLPPRYKKREMSGQNTTCSRI
jgi:hypothetical protein